MYVASVSSLYINKPALCMFSIMIKPKKGGTLYYASFLINNYTRFNNIYSYKPIDISIDIAFQNFISDIEILKDSWGNAFWPTYNLNNIGNLAAGQAYQIKMNVSTPIQFNLTD